MPTTVTKVLSVNVGRAREFDYNGRPAKSAIWKLPVAGRIAARGVNLEGDDQADRKAHGGPDKSVYAYSIEDVRWWEETLGRSLQYGEFGLRRITTTFPVGCSLENAIATRRNLELF
jgi:MOSC domain-containing protein YiiM